MEAQAAKLYTKKVDGKLVDRGVAFPICVSVNDVVCNHSPLATEETVGTLPVDVSPIDNSRLSRDIVMCDSFVQKHACRCLSRNARIGFSTNQTRKSGFTNGSNRFLIDSHRIHQSTSKTTTTKIIIERRHTKDIPPAPTFLFEAVYQVHHEFTHVYEIIHLYITAPGFSCQSRAYRD